MAFVAVIGEYSDVDAIHDLGEPKDVVTRLAISFWSWRHRFENCLDDEAAGCFGISPSRRAKKETIE